jgi:hypothetical protein
VIVARYEVPGKREKAPPSRRGRLKDVRDRVLKSVSHLSETLITSTTKSNITERGPSKERT